jgi:hypothetical protein
MIKNINNELTFKIIEMTIIESMPFNANNFKYNIKQRRINYQKSIYHIIKQFNIKIFPIDECHIILPYK